MWKEALMAPKQLKLFKIAAGKEPVYFTNRKAAKHVRDDLNAHGHSAVVMRGPVHWRGESFNTSRRMRGARSTW